MYEGVKNGKLDINERIGIAMELVKTMIDMKSVKVTHRDVKPQNLIVRKREKDILVKLTDFGIGRGYNQVEGTPGFSPVDLAGWEGCDWYSVGITISFLLLENESFWQSVFRPLLNDNERRKIEESNIKYHREVLQIVDRLMDMGVEDEIKVTI